jgi:hypothetical protein
MEGLQKTTHTQFLRLVPFLNKKISPDISLVSVQPADTEDMLRKRIRLALPRIIEDLGRQAGEAAWRDNPPPIELDESDKARLMRETAEAYQRKLSQRQINEIAEEVLRQIKARQDGKA